MDWLAVAVVLAIIQTAWGYGDEQDWNWNPNYDDNRILVWCTVNYQETQKCQDFAMAMTNADVQRKFSLSAFQINCTQAYNKDECMDFLDENKADLTTLDPGEMFIGGRYHSLIPIAQERYEGGETFYYAVAVTKKNALPNMRTLGDLRGSNACFAGVGTLAGWIVPIKKLMDQGWMPVTDCNNHVKSTISFFGISCAVNSLTDKYNPLGDNSDELCRLCGTDSPTERCTSRDPYAGFEGAFRCLVEKGQIAFLRHNTVDEMLARSDDFQGVNRANFELICDDGSRAPLESYRNCNWGRSPAHAVVTSSAKPYALRLRYQKFLEKAVQVFGGTFDSDVRRANSTYNSTGYDRSPYNPGQDSDRNPYNPGVNSDRDRNPYNTGLDTDRDRNPYNPGQNTDRDRNPYSPGQNTDRDRNPYNTGLDTDRDRNPYNPGQNTDRDRNPYSPYNPNNPGQNTDRDRNPYDSGQNSNRDRNYQGNYDRDRNPEYDSDRNYNRNQYYNSSNPNYNQNDRRNNDRNLDYDRRNSDRNLEYDRRNFNPYDTNPSLTTTTAYPYYPQSYSLNQSQPQYYPQASSLHQSDPNYNYLAGGDFHLFESVPKYGIRRDLLFQDTAVGLNPLPEAQQSFKDYLGPSLDLIMGIRRCPVGRMSLCVVSEAEMLKCVKMKDALKAQLLKPDMTCYKGYSQTHCMQAVRNGDADVAVFDAGDVYNGGYRYGLIPIMSEVYNLGRPEFYAVAVALLGDPSTDLTYLKDKNTCHTGIQHGAGWVMPMAYLLSNGRMRGYGCNSLQAASQYFTKACVPGAVNSEYIYDRQYDNLCDLCHGSSSGYCQRSSAEDYYGYLGAFRCLVEGGGQVAFVKHTTVSEITDGKRAEWWARNTLASDYELLCRDGTRAPVTDYERCNLGLVKANAVVTRGQGYNYIEVQAYINLLTYAQQYFGRKYQDDFGFSLYYSPPPYADLIFQDATNKLQVVPENQRNYRDYLGPEFLKARALVDCRAGSTSNIGSLLTIALLSVTAFWIGRF